MRTIRVTGRGNVSMKPDRTCLTLELSGVCRSYEDTLASSAEKTRMLRSALEELGFDRADLRTVSFGVDTEYETHWDQHNNSSRRFVGYRFEHTLKVEFDSDNDLLGHALGALSRCGAKPEIRISYTVSDPDAARNELLARATADARRKAELLAAASGVTLGDIQAVDYSWVQVDFDVQPMSGGIESDVLYAKAASIDLDIEPDDIRATDTVTVVWEIR